MSNQHLPGHDNAAIIATDGVAPGLHRRSLLTAAVSGFALAASGVLLPDWLVEEADAARHPVGTVRHRADRRRQQRHTRKRQRHRGGARNHRRKPHVIFKGIKLTVFNDLADPLQTYPWVTVNYFSGTLDWQYRGRHDIGHQSSMTFDTEFLHAGVEVIGLSLPFVWAENPPGGKENVSVQYGGEMRSFGYDGGTTAIDHTNLSVGQETHVVVPLDRAYRNVALTIRRESDTNEHKVFTITVGSA